MFLEINIQKTLPGRVRVKFAQNEDHEKATKNAQTLFFQADEGHEKATKKPRKSHEKVTSKNVTSNEKSSEICKHSGQNGSCSKYTTYIFIFRDH